MRPARRGLLAVGVLAAIVLLPRVFDSSYALTLLTQMAIFITFALSYNMIFGQAGMLSFGHAVYAGLGAYATILLLKTLAGQPGAWQSPLAVALLPLAGGLAGAGFGIILGYPTTRRAGTPFAMITLGIGEMVYAAALMFPAVFGGEGGVSADRVLGQPLAGVSFGPAVEVYYLSAAWCLVAAAAMYAFTRTPLGLVARAVRDNPERIEFIGYSARTVRYLVLIASSFFAGIAGGLAAINFELVTTENLSTLQSGAVLLATFIGGASWFVGPILGAIVYVLFAMALSDHTPAWLFYLGLFFVLMVMYAPQGLAGLLVQARELLRSGELLPLLRRSAGVIANGLMAGLLFVLAIELAYYRALDSIGAAELRRFGLRLDSSSSLVWGLLLTALALALAMFLRARRRLVLRSAAVSTRPAEPGEAI